MEKIESGKTMGVYSTMEEVEIVEEGGAKGETLDKLYWFVTETEDGRFAAQRINKNHVPGGPKAMVSRSELVDKYEPEPKYYRNITLPILQKIETAVKLGEKHRDAGNLDRAEEAFLRALSVDEQNAKANLGLGDVYVGKGEEDKVQEVLERLLKMDEVFEANQRIELNRFGMSLRKSKMFDKALKLFLKALEIKADDEHLHFNLARVFYEKGDTGQCRKHLLEAKRLNPAFTEADKFLKYLEKHPGPEA
ncbi:MAG: tetratricopeptide repeat protein [Desulfovibrionaceae bacterium]|nr:tetratricopeptide repeat protein [Desulfovibrionaceae bacterium]MBF0513039.1 tetratricopeptide repeat protein [Desulfovibrionaceae bacterium]